MNDKDLENVREKLFADVEEEPETETQKVTFEDLFKKGGEGRKVPPKPAGPVAEEPTEEAPATEEERMTLNLGQIRRLIAAHRWRIADAERRVDDLRVKLAGLETEYKALVNEPAPPEARRASEPVAVEEKKPRKVRTASGPSPQRNDSSWKDAASISLEEAAWRILIEQGKSLPLWRIASAIRRKGYPAEFTESGLSACVRKSTRLGFTGEGHIYIK
jgi:hypothetical protein